MKPVPPEPPKPIEGEALTYGSDQAQYLPLPAWRMPGSIGQTITRWRPSTEERAAIAAGADIWLSQLTFRQPLQPVRIGVRGSDVREGWPDGD